MERREAGLQRTGHEGNGEGEEREQKLFITSCAIYGTTLQYG